MKCYYINLDEAAERRQALEAQFARTHSAGWELVRHVARTPAWARAVPGTLQDTEKACYLSHQGAIEAALAGAQPALVIEDDTLLSPRAFQVIDAFAAGLHAVRWDLIFLDLFPGSVNAMLRAIRLKRALVRKGTVELIDLVDFPFSCASAYLVNPASSGLKQLLFRPAPLDLPIDLALATWIKERQLNAYGFFPFLTTLSPLADRSQISPAASNARLVYNTLRRMLWIDAQLAHNQASLDDVKQSLLDDELAAFGTLLAALASDQVTLV